MLRAAIDRPVVEANCTAGSPDGGPGYPLAGLLAQLASVLRLATDGQYCRKPVGPVAGSLGGHVRHCLDHVERLLVGIDDGCVNYDLRARGTAVEHSRLAALDEIDRLRASLLAPKRLPLRRKLRLTAMLSADSAPVQVSTTVGRELAFVISHTVHHQALIAVMLPSLGIEAPRQFGYAPATIAYLRQHPCAQ